MHMISVTLGELSPIIDARCVGAQAGAPGRVSLG